MSGKLKFEYDNPFFKSIVNFMGFFWFFLHQSLGVEGGFDVEKPKVKITVKNYKHVSRLQVPVVQKLDGT